jgi:hypothetical protein
VELGRDDIERNGKSEKRRRELWLTEDGRRIRDGACRHGCADLQSNGRRIENTASKPRTILYKARSRLIPYFDRRLWQVRLTSLLNSVVKGTDLSQSLAVLSLMQTVQRSNTGKHVARQRKLLRAEAGQGQ